MPLGALRAGLAWPAPLARRGLGLATWVARWPGAASGPTGADEATLPRTDISLRRAAVLGLLGSGLVVVGSVVGGDLFAPVTPGAWFFGSAGGPLGSLAAPDDFPPALAMLLVFGGLVLLARTWLALLRHLHRRPGLRVRSVVVVIALWAVPLAIAPPLFSRDVYNYVGQGEMVSHHIDPYQYGTGVLGSTPFSDLGGQIWSNSPSPYGPVFLGLDGLAIGLAGHHELPDLVLLRLLEIAGLALVVAALPTLAREYGRDPAEAVLLGAGSPIALVALVGGAHNDALMIGLLVAGLAVAKRFGPVPGIVLCALAAGVKAPAALGVVVIGWGWAPAGASIRRRVAGAAGAVGIGAGTLAAVSALTGVGWGWTRTLGTASEVSTDSTPLSAIAHVVSGAAQLVDLPLSFATAQTVLDVAGILAAGVLCLWLLVRSPVIGQVRALGLMLLAVSFLSPILWAWYLTWGLVLLAAVATGRLRKALIVITVLWAFIGERGLAAIGRALQHAGLGADLLLLVGVAGVVLIPLAGSRRRGGLGAEQVERVEWPEIAAGAADGSGQRVGA